MVPVSKLNIKDKTKHLAVTCNNIENGLLQEL